MSGSRRSPRRSFFTFLSPTFQRLKGSKLASLGAWSAVHSRHLASHVDNSFSLAFRLCRCLVVDKNPVPHCLECTCSEFASTCVGETTRFNHCSAGRGLSTGRNGMSPHHVRILPAESEAFEICPAHTTERRVVIKRHLVSPLSPIFWTSFLANTSSIPSCQARFLKSI